jgi:hypothetical protein
MAKKGFLLGIHGMALAFGMVLAVLTTIGCSIEVDTTDEKEATYLVRGGYQSNAAPSYYELGVYISPNGSLVPYLVEDNTVSGTKTLSEVENTAYQLGFTQSWVQSVKNNLNSDGSAFVFYLNTNNYYRWLWITKN